MESWQVSPCLSLMMTLNNQWFPRNSFCYSVLWEEMSIGFYSALTSTMALTRHGQGTKVGFYQLASVSVPVTHERPEPTGCCLGLTGPTASWITAHMTCVSWMWRAPTWLVKHTGFLVSQTPPTMLRLIVFVLLRRTAYKLEDYVQ
jgi:hypothetical protein